MIPPEDMEKREKAIAIYRDKGPARSLGRLVTVLKTHHQDIAVSRPTIERWSSMHDCAEHVEAYDQVDARAQSWWWRSGDVHEPDGVRPGRRA